MGVRATQTVEGLDGALREFRAARRSAAEGKYAVACMAARQSAADALEAADPAAANTTTADHTANWPAQRSVLT